MRDSDLRMITRFSFRDEITGSCFSRGTIRYSQNAALISVIESHIRIQYVPAMFKGGWVFIGDHDDGSGNDL